jgi:hypothetical protein
LATVAAPIGSETRATLDVGHEPSARSLVAARVGIETVSLEGFAGARSIVVGLLARSRVGRMSVVADVDVASDPHQRRVVLALGAIARAGGAATIVATARFDGSSVVALGASVVSRLHESLCLLAGYDDGTESVRGAAVVSFAGWQVSTGVFHHAVLGLSHGVTLAWTR